MKILWTNLADTTFEDEIDFILHKWNSKEAEKFIDLVEKFEKALAANPYLARCLKREE